MLRLLFLLVLGVASIAPAASGQSQANSGAVDAPPEFTLEIVNRAPCLSNRDMAQYVAAHLGASKSFPRTDGAQHVMMRWTFEPLPDAGGSVNYIGPGTTRYPAPRMLRHPVLARVEIIVGETSVAHQQVVLRARCVPETHAPRNAR